MYIDFALGNLFVGEQKRLFDRDELAKVENARLRKEDVDFVVDLDFVEMFLMKIDFFLDYYSERAHYYREFYSEGLYE